MSDNDFTDLLDSAADLISKLTPNYREKEGKSLIRSFLKAHSRQWAEFEKAARQVESRLDIDSAVGVQLDRIGEIVGERRGLRDLSDDPRYRDLIKVRIAINTSRGLPDDIIAAFRRLTGVDRIQIVNTGLAAIAVNIEGQTTRSVDDYIALNMGRIVAGGVKLGAVTKSKAHKVMAFTSVAKRDRPNPPGTCGFGSVDKLPGDGGWTSIISS